LAAHLREDPRLIVAVAGATVVVAAVLLRVAAIDDGTLHEDEGLFAAWGLYIWRTRDLALVDYPGYPPDKFPLLPWLVAASIRVFGDGPLAIRLPDLAASAFATSALFAAGTRLAGLAGGILAGLVFALSPFAIAYGGSVFTDPLAIGLGSGALAAAILGRGGTAGILSGLAVGAKIFGLAYAPLVAVMAVVVGRIRSGLWFLLTFSVVMAGWFALEGFRTSIEGAPSILALGAEHNPIRPVDPAAWGDRIGGWTYYASWLISDLGPRIVLAAAGLAALLISRSRVALVLGAFVVGYVGLLITASFPVYDRYALYLLPAIALLAGLGLRSVRWPVAALAISVFVFGSVPGVRAALDGTIDVGPRTRTPVYGDVDDLCRWIRQEAVGEVVWNHSLSWPFAYCLQGSKVETYYYPEPELIHGDGAMNLVVGPADAPDTVERLRAVGWTVIPQPAPETRAGFEIYTITRP
jgi:4-amino-4-deoxy-L-arabinose transferase-like glycosyltransferase